MTAGTGLLGLLAATLALQGATVKDNVLTNKDPAYSVTIPIGYVPVAPRDAGHSFDRAAGPEPWERFRIDFVPLERTLAQKSPPPVDPLLRIVRLSEPREVKPIRIPWEGLEIDGIECRWSLEGVDQAARIAWMPTAGQATAVCVSGPSTLSARLQMEFLGLVASFKGRTAWLTEEEERSLQRSSWPSYVPPALSGLFLLAWALLFRGRPTTAPLLRLAWHASVPLSALAAYYFLNQSTAAREKMGIEAPVILWFLVIGPLALFHLVMIAHRIRTSLELGD